MFPCLHLKPPTEFSQSARVHAAVLAKVLFANSFYLLAGCRTRPGIRLGAASFQKVKQPLLGYAGFLDIFRGVLCVAQDSCALLCVAVF
jgi:hypothetical protein